MEQIAGRLNDASYLFGTEESWWSSRLFGKGNVLGQEAPAQCFYEEETQRRGTFRGVGDLIKAIQDYIQRYNRNPQPFRCVSQNIRHQGGGPMDIRGICLPKLGPHPHLLNAELGPQHEEH